VGALRVSVRNRTAVPRQAPSAASEGHCLAKHVARPAHGGCPGGVAFGDGSRSGGVDPSWCGSLWRRLAGHDAAALCSFTWQPNDRRCAAQVWRAARPSGQCGHVAAPLGRHPRPRKGCDAANFEGVRCGRRRFAGLHTAAPRRVHGSACAGPPAGGGRRVQSRRQNAPAADPHAVRCGEETVRHYAIPC